MIQFFLAPFLLVSGGFSYGSSPQACKAFLSEDKQFFLVGEAYQASDLAVIGELVYREKPKLLIKNKIKGATSQAEIELTSRICQGTACTGGFSLPPKLQFLFLLKKKDGVYNSVSGNGNNSCPVVFEIENGSVKFGNRKVSIKLLKKYLESNPEPIEL